MGVNQRNLNFKPKFRDNPWLRPKDARLLQAVLDIEELNIQIGQHAILAEFADVPRGTLYQYSNPKFDGYMSKMERYGMIARPRWGKYLLTERGRIALALWRGQQARLRATKAQFPDKSTGHMPGCNLPYESPEISA